MSQKILQALVENKQELLLANIDPTFKIGDLKELIISAMLKQRMYLQVNEKAPLEGWKINDTRKWFFENWSKECLTNYEKK